jgi:hypothetical protein
LLDLLGLRDGVFPGVVLLSRRRWSGCPVDFAIGFGPGLSAMNALLCSSKITVFVYFSK